MRDDRESVEIVDLDERVPPPSAALLARISADGAVAVRRPMVEWAVQLAAWLLVAGITVTALGLRHDHPALRWSAVGWILVIGGVLACLLVPQAGQVLASAVRIRAALVALPLAGLALALGALDGPGVSTHAARDELRALVHCLALGVLVAAPAIVGGWFALRRLVPMTGALGGMALGAAAGALGAFVLHLVCPTSGALHTGAGHAGALVVCGVIGGVIGALLERRR